MSLRWGLVVLVFGALLASGNAPVAEPRAVSALAPGKGMFEFDGWAGPALRVWYLTPARVTAKTPVVFVMHGVNRDAGRYRDEWAPLAARHGVILVVPEYSQADFPGSNAYNTGGFRNADGSPRAKARWSFAAIEPLFDAVRARTGTRVPAYALYGHSAGAQFVHRYVLFMPEARLGRAIAANAGWYTMPDLNQPYPYGLAGSPAGAPELKRALGKPLTVLLGAADTDPDHPNLRRTPEAMAQGMHRFARGQAFHAAGQAAASRLGVPFGWSLVTVEGVGHKNGEMAKAAAPLLIE